MSGSRRGVLANKLIRLLGWSAALELFLVAAPYASVQTPKTVDVAGEVVDAGTDLPIDRAVVALSSVAGSVLTDADGRFQFRVSAGRYNLHVSKGGWIGGVLGQVRPGGQGVELDVRNGRSAADIRLRLWRSGSISGVVTESGTENVVTGYPVQLWRQVIRAGVRRLDLQARTTSNDEGRYRFGGLEPADFLVTAAAPIIAEPDESQRVAGGTDDSARSYLQTMTNAGAGPPSADRTLVGPFDGWLLSAPVADLAQSPIDSAWKRHAVSHVFNLTQDGGALISLSASEQVAHDLPIALIDTFQVSGQLDVPAGSAKNYAVHLMSRTSSEFPVLDTAVALSDSHGMFRFFGVPSGSYVLRTVKVPWPDGPAGLALAEDGLRGRVVFASSAALEGIASSAERPLFGQQFVDVFGEPVVGVRLSLGYPPSIKGTIVSDTAGPGLTQDELRKTVLALERADGRSELSPVARGDETGEFTIHALSPGQYFIRPAALPPGWHFVSVVRGGRDLDDVALSVDQDVDDLRVVLSRSVSGLIPVPS